MSPELECKVIHGKLRGQLIETRLDFLVLHPILQPLQKRFLHIARENRQFVNMRMRVVERNLHHFRYHRATPMSNDVHFDAQVIRKPLVPV